MDEETGTIDQQPDIEREPQSIDQPQEEPQDDPVDDASADSFPASDPPSFTRSTTD